MNANEMVTVARLADRYEKRLSREHDALEVATHDFNKFKRDAPTLWRFLRASDRSDRNLGDWLYEFFVRAASSGMTLKNFAADEAERLGIPAEQQSPASRHHATKKTSTAQLDREIAEALAGRNKHAGLAHATRRVVIGNGLKDGVGTAGAGHRLKKLREAGATDIALASTGRLRFTRNGQQYEYQVTPPRDRREADAFEAAGTVDSPLIRALADIAAES